MTCPICDSKLKVVDIVHDTFENETYRRKVCTNCGLNTYTKETPLEEWSDELDAIWHKYYRKKTTKPKKRKKSK